MQQNEALTWLNGAPATMADHSTGGLKRHPSKTSQRSPSLLSPKRQLHVQPRGPFAAGLLCQVVDLMCVAAKWHLMPTTQDSQNAYLLQPSQRGVTHHHSLQVAHSWHHHWLGKPSRVDLLTCNTSCWQGKVQKPVTNRPELVRIQRNATCAGLHCQLLRMCM
jgi:hypothetical protein